MTIRSIPRLALLMALCVLAIGCGSDCLSFCEAQKDCENADKDRDCENHCDKLEVLVERAGCEDQYDDLVSCQSEQDDICNPDERACASQSSAYSGCVTKYCSEHPKDCDPEFCAEHPEDCPSS